MKNHSYVYRMFFYSRDAKKVFVYDSTDDQFLNDYMEKLKEWGIPYMFYDNRLNEEYGWQWLGVEDRSQRIRDALDTGTPIHILNEEEIQMDVLELVIAHKKMDNSVTNNV